MLSRNVCEYNYQLKVRNSPGKRRARLNYCGSPLTNPQNVRQNYNDRIAYQVLVEKLEGKRTLGRPRRKGVDNTEMYLQEI
jgi:hypothetical protein